MYLLDTNTLSLIHAGQARVGERRGGVRDDDVAITIITRIEILQARYDYLLKAADGAQLRRAQAWLEKSEHLLAQIRTIPVDEAAAAVSDRLLQDKKRRKGPLGRADLLIAAITLSRNATLVTRNVKDFRRIPGLAIENWAD